MSTFKQNALRIIAVIGLIAVLLLGAWGIIQLAFIIPGFFSGSSSTTTKEAIALTLPSSAVSGSAFNLGWSHTGKNGEYSYAVSYSCGNVTIKAPVAAGTYKDVPCETPFNYTNAAQGTQLIATLTGSSATTVTLNVAATKLSAGKQTASATGRMTINTKAKTTTTTKTTTSSTTKKTSSTYVPAATRAALYGYPDLQVRMTSNFTSVQNGSRIALQFVVENAGTNVVPAGWNFQASLPYTPVYTFTSDAQQALYPGDKIVYTLGYDAQLQGSAYSATGGCDGWTYPCNPGTQVYGGPGTCNQYGPCAIPGYPANPYGYYNPTAGYKTASVQVDPYNLVWELNESNNTAGISYQVY